MTDFEAATLSYDAQRRINRILGELLTAEQVFLRAGSRSEEWRTAEVAGVLDDAYRFECAEHGIDSDDYREAFSAEVTL